MQAKMPTWQHFWEVLMSKKWDLELELGLTKWRPNMGFKSQLFFGILNEEKVPSKVSLSSEILSQFVQCRFDAKVPLKLVYYVWSIIT